MTTQPAGWRPRDRGSRARARIRNAPERYQGEKKLSSMPYTLTINAGGHATLRIGTRIPVSMMPGTNAAKDAPAGLPFQYQDVGTNIDCSAAEVDGGRFSLVVSIDDSSVYPDDAAGGVKGNPHSG